MHAITTKASDWEVVIGLEVHAQIKSKTKLFSNGSCAFGAPPNSCVNLFDAAMPGTLPVLNMSCVKGAIKAGLGLKSKINLHSEFDRKHYFYPDLPHGYQITQYNKPIATGGKVVIEDFQGRKKDIRIHHIHIEQDAGKSIHDLCADKTYIDLNRAGVPLMEIVTEPDIRSAKEACDFVTKLRLILQYVGASGANMEKGELRCDANVSVRKFGSDAMGQRCEIKNLNSIKSLMQAIEYESKRQIKAIENGEQITVQTRLFDTKEQITRQMRDKEDATDYRYFPDPDLLPLVLEKEYVDKILHSLPELPDNREERYKNQFGLTDYDASVIVQNKKAAEYFDHVNSCVNCNPKLVARWLTVELFGAIAKKSIKFNQEIVPAKDFADLISLIESSVISERIAKEVLVDMIDTKKSPNLIVKEKNLAQITDPNQIKLCATEVFKQSKTELEQYLNGKEKLFGFFVGQIMKKTGGKANPQITNQVLKTLIGELKNE